MAKILEIYKDGAPVLRKTADPVDMTDLSSLTNTIENMHLTMIKNDPPGVGLAAPQVGISSRFFIMNPKPEEGLDKLTVVINPEIISHSEEKEKKQEACLSVPKIAGLVSRYKSIRVKFYNQHGQRFEKKLEGFKARIFQHEFDHLNGILYTDLVEFEDEFSSLEDYLAEKQKVETVSKVN